MGGFWLGFFVGAGIEFVVLLLILGFFDWLDYKDEKDFKDLYQPGSVRKDA